jgi:hypothetical protein
VLCLIVVPLSPGKNPFAVQLNNNNKYGVFLCFVKKPGISTSSARLIKYHALKLDGRDRYREFLDAALDGSVSFKVRPLYLVSI